MIKLKGSEKQIAWAEKIRASFLKNAKKDYERKVSVYKRIINISKTEEGVERAKKAIENETHKYTFMVDKYNNETRSAWFIQMQDRDYDYLFDHYLELEKKGKL